LHHKPALFAAYCAAKSKRPSGWLHFKAADFSDKSRRLLFAEAAGRHLAIIAINTEKLIRYNFR